MKKTYLLLAAGGAGALIIAVAFMPAFAMRESNCADGIDNDGDGLTDDADADCDLLFESNCTDGIDNDVDGYIDALDTDCTAPPPDCPAWHKLVGADCVPKLPNEGMVLQDLNLDVNYDFGYTGGKWRIEAVVETGPYPSYLLFRWVTAEGVIVDDVRGGGASGMTGSTEIAESVGDNLTRDPTSWGKQAALHIFISKEPLVRVPASLEWDVDGKTFQHVATRTFTPTADQSNFFGQLFCLIAPSC